MLPLCINDKVICPELGLESFTFQGSMQTTVPLYLGNSFISVLKKIHIDNKTKMLKVHIIGWELTVDLN